MAITVKNVSSATVSLLVPVLKFRRELPPGREVPLSQEVYEELTYSAGFSKMLKNHYLVLKGVEEDNAAEVQEDTSTVYGRDEIAKMMDDNNPAIFLKFIKDARPAEKESAVQLAVEKNLTSGPIPALIKQYCGVDIGQAAFMQS